MTDNPQENARLCDALYVCPRSERTGERMGPLVAYAGTYPVLGVEKKDEPHYVGDVYFNFARVEPHSGPMNWFTDQTYRKLCEARDAGTVQFDFPNLVLCGTPLGGYKLADAISARHNVDSIKAEKRVKVVGTKERKEESDILFSRHEPGEGDEVVITEDVTNNFLSTGQLVGGILQRKAKPVAILCVLNRSMTVDKVWEHDDRWYLASGQRVDHGPISLPVISLIRMPYDEYQQDDPAVAEDVARGNVVWNPKRAEEWAKLMQAMQGAG
jgi:orotate phosphoribosyltransferase